MAFTAATRGLTTDESIFWVGFQRKNGPACRLPAIAVSVLPLRWSSPDGIVIELKDVLQLGVGLAGWGLAAYQYWRNELTERPFAAFNHAAFKRGVGHWRHPYGRR